MQNAPFGIVGLETAVPLTISELVRPGVITPLQMAAKMSTNPARILGIDKGNLAAGVAFDMFPIPFQKIPTHNIPSHNTCLSSDLVFVSLLLHQ